MSEPTPQAESAADHPEVAAAETFAGALAHIEYLREQRAAMRALLQGKEKRIAELEVERDEARDTATHFRNAAADLRSTPAPEAVEVPAGEAREGDTVTRSGVILRVDPDRGFGIRWDDDDLDIDYLGGFANGPRVTRPSIPLPTEPGAVGGDLWQMTVARDVLAGLLRDEMDASREAVSSRDRLTAALTEISNTAAGARLHGIVRLAQQGLAAAGVSEGGKA